MEESVNILLVEDNPGDALLIKETLRDSIYRDAILFVSQNVTNTLKFMQENIQLVLLDLGLPDSDGLDTVLKIQRYFPNSALIVLTGLSDEKVAVDSLREGVQNYLNKNEIDTKILERTIRFSLERHHIIQRLRVTDNQLVRSKIFLEKAQEVAHVGSWVADLISDHAELSNEAKRIFGFRPEEFDKKPTTFFSMIHPDDLAMVKNGINEAVSQGKFFEITHRILRKDLVMRWVHTQAEIVYDATGIPNTLVGSIQDITLIKEAEDKIIKANRLYSFISHINQTIVHVKDEETLFKRACKIAIDLGKFKMAWIGMADTETRKIKLKAHCRANIRDIKMLTDYSYDSNGPIEKVLKGKGYYVVNDMSQKAGHTWNNYAPKRGFKSGIALAIKRGGKIIGTFNLYSGVSNFFDKEEIVMLNEVAGDISFALDVFDKEKQRKQTEENLERSKYRLDEAQAIAKLGNWELNFATGSGIWSAETCKIYGISPKKNYQSFDSWLSFIHPDDLSHVKQQLNEDQKELKGSTLENRIVLKDGTVKHLMSVSKFEFDEFGNPIGIYGITQDLTGRKLAEEERTKMVKDIIQRNKNLEQFGYIVSHNLRLPVANIIAIADILKNDVLTGTQKEQFVDAMLHSVKKLDEVVHDLNYVLHIKNDTNENKEQVVFSELVNTISQSIQNIIDKGKVTINTDFSQIDGITTIKSYSHSIFYNLISNSIKYRRLDVPLILDIRSKLTKDGIRLSFSDNGMGIDLSRHKDEVFGLYKRFHSGQIVGKGMGLFMVKTQVESLGGKIGIKSEVNKGTEFLIEFDKTI